MKWVIGALKKAALWARQSKEDKRRTPPVQHYRKAMPQAYVPAGDLLTAYEKQFFRSLRICAQEWRLGVCFKPRAADIVKPQACASRETWWRRFRFLSQRHIDFVLLDRSFRPVLAIELNDASHLRENRRKRDAELAAVFAAAGVPLVFVEGEQRGDVTAIRRQLSRYLPGADQAR